jgi:two-component system chemotaxis response regulator CheB
LTLNRDIVAIGGSAGGIEALKRIVAQLPADLPAAVLVVIHLPVDSPSYLPQILDGAGPLRAVAAEEGLPVRNGQIIVARGGFHMLVRDGRVHLGTGPRENRSKPAVDPLFRSIAATYRGRAIGVVLSGWLNDGTAGLYAIKRCGGVAVVQDPDDAIARDMPQSALRNVPVDYVARLEQIGSLIARLAREEAGPDMPVPSEIQVEADIAARGGDSIAQTSTLGARSIMGCPECGGVLTEMRNGNLLRFRCHTGHSYTAESLLAEQGQAVERALLSAMRTLEERAAMWTRLAERNEDLGNRRTVSAMRKNADDAKTEADALRQILQSRRERVSDELISDQA